MRKVIKQVVEAVAGAAAPAPIAGEAARAKLQAAGADVEARRTAYEAALLDGTEAAVAETEKAYHEAQRAEERAQFALKAAERRHAAEIKAAAEADTARRWTEVRRLAAERRKAARQLSTALEGVQEVLQRWAKIDDAIFAAHPRNRSDLSFTIRGSRRDDMFRLGVNKLRLPMADIGASVAHGMPSIEECVARDESVILYEAPE
jgi:hypothetical protein